MALLDVGFWILDFGVRELVLRGMEIVGSGFRIYLEEHRT